jgi:hypothetical protein
MDRMRPVLVRMPPAATDPPTIRTIQVASAPPYHTAPACKASRTGRDPDVKEFGDRAGQTLVVGGRVLGHRRVLDLCAVCLRV